MHHKCANVTQFININFKGGSSAFVSKQKKIDKLKVSVDAVHVYSHR